MKIRVTKRPRQLLLAVKAVRHYSGLGLIESKDFVFEHKWFEVDDKHSASALAELEAAGATVEVKYRKLRIKEGWHGAGKTGKRLGPDVFVRQDWTPVLWDDEEDPDWHKSAGLSEIEVDR